MSGHPRTRSIRIPGIVLAFLSGGLVFGAGILAGNADTGGPLLGIGAVVLLIVAAILGLYVLGWIPVGGGDGIEEERDSTKLRAARERARAVYEMASTLSATLDYNAVLESALDVGVLGLREMTPNARLIGAVMLFQGDALCVVASRRLTPRDTKVTVSGHQGVLSEALKSAEPVLTQDSINDPELSYFVAFQDAKSVLAIPLRAGFDNYGLLVFGATDADAFSDEHIELLTAVTSQATIALQNAKLYQTLREEKERIVEIEEDARKKLARDLHDGPTQSVSAIAMRVNLIRRMVDHGQQGVSEELQKVEDLARKTTKEIRHMLFTLRPLVLETQGLGAALDQFKQKLMDTHQLHVILHLQQGSESLLDSHAQGVLFYIIEEAVNNARKHAQATHIDVRLYRRENYAIVEVQDDGVGFDVNAVNKSYDQRGSLGMVNMHERAELIEATLMVDSTPGEGTKISVLVPIKADVMPGERSPTRPKRPTPSQRTPPVAPGSPRSNTK